MSWVFGLLFSLLLGHFIVEYFLWALRKKMALGEKPLLLDNPKRVPPWLTGAMERLFFTILVALNISGTPAAMIGWLGLKVATNWNHPDYKDNPKARSFAFSGLLAGLLSLLVAFVGGRICRI
ncbi:hypothetical protein [Azotobacter chroococcum]|jgi:hypothetical protein|uniref:hypothetical protein n=1 Tax=Azotobacter chroococcum TaxID=353 RepID=UPI0010AEB64D|nr:hypothetical protein [Azotobacter chroococcum]TKD44795.1 hypothetical protein FCG41_05700 [Azotobacter chroococcum]